VFDGFGNKTFNMHVMLFCTTIDDSPTYGNLSRYSVNDHKACLICEKDTASQQYFFSAKNKMN